jgi:DNA-binding beta-propeller fold protein YncE
VRPRRTLRAAAPGLVAAALLLGILPACAQNAPPPLIGARVQVGSSPGAPVVAGRYVWVPDPGHGRLLVIDPTAARIVRSLAVGDRSALVRAGCEPFSVHQGTPQNFVLRRCDLPSAVEPGAGVVWVGRNDDMSVEAVDVQSLRVTRHVVVGHPVWDAAASGGTLWVTSYFDNLLLKVDLASGRVVDSVPGLPNGPSAVIAAFGSVWVSSSRHGVVVRVDPRADRVIAEIATGYPLSRPLPLIAAAGAIWCRLESGDQLVRIDPATNRIVSTAPAPIFMGVDGADRLAYDGRDVWVSGLGLEAVAARTGTVDRRLSVTATAVDYGFGHLWANDAGGPLYRLNT